MPLALDPEQITSFAGGMNDVAAATAFRPDEVRLLENGRVSTQGAAVRRRGGSKELNATAINSGAKCWFCQSFEDASGTRHMIGAFGTKFFSSSDDGATWTDRTGALAPTATWYTWAIMRVGTENRMIFANGDSNVYYWTGSGNVQTLSGVASGVEYVAVQNGRLWVAGHDGIKVDASVFLDPDDWSSSNGAFTVNAATHDGDVEITGLFATGAFLLVFKRRSTNYIEGYGIRSVQVQAGPRGVSRSVGCVGQRSVAAVGDRAVMWLSHRGFEYWVPGGRIVLVSRPVTNFIKDLAWDAIEADPLLPSAIYWPREHEYWCAVPGLGTDNTSIFVYRPADASEPEVETPAIWIQRSGDLGSGETVYVDSDGYLAVGDDPNDATTSLNGGYLEIDNAGVFTGFFVEVDNDGYLTLVSDAAWGTTLFTHTTASDVDRPHQGTLDGYVEEMETGDLDGVDSAGAGGSMLKKRIKTRPLFFADPIGTKQAKQVRLKVAAESAVTLTVAVEVDGVRGSDHTVSVTGVGFDQPIEKRLRVTGRGEEHVIIVESEDDVLVTSLELMAERFRRR